MNLPIEHEFDHVGIAVKSLDEGEVAYKTMGLKCVADEVVESEKVRVRMFELGNAARIELLEPTDETSVVSKFIKKRGEGIHHICLRVKNIRECLSQLRDANLRLVHEEPFEGANNCQVAFIHPSSTGGVLVELSQPKE